MCAAYNIKLKFDTTDLLCYVYFI